MATFLQQIGNLPRATARGTGRFFHWLWYGEGTRRPWIRRLIAVVVFFLVPAPIALILLCRFLPVPGTPEMLLQLVTFHPVTYRWRELDEISPRLARAVIGSEDQNFCYHHGFDWEEIGNAWRSHERHPRRQLRGASTISQQTARSLFLVSTRSWVRKGMEAYLTVLIEALWPKRRILTVYLNVIDWGNGNFGAEAASNAYFGKTAAELTETEAARLAAVLPNPDRWHAASPGPYVRGRTYTLVSRSHEVTNDDLDSCVWRR